jgi:DNA transformation protein
MPQSNDNLQKFGPKSREWLRDIGITSEAQIRDLGVVEVYRRLKARFPDRVTLNMLYGLEAALTGTRWNLLPDEVKAELRREAENESTEY